MALRRPGRFPPLGVAVSIVLLAGAPLAQQEFPAAVVAPIAGATVSSFPSPARLVVPVASDVRLESSELGFERGAGPAVGRTVTWRGADHDVIAVSASDGGPTFSGGSRHVVAAEGQSLLVSLRPVDRDAAAPFTAVAGR